MIDLWTYVTTVSGVERHICKQLIFGLIFGKPLTKLALSLGMSVGEITHVVGAFDECIERYTTTTNQPQTNPVDQPQANPVDQPQANPVDKPQANPVDKPKVTPGDLTDELYREYDIPGRSEPYRIDDPVTLYTRPGGTTHRVVDAKGMAHCVAFPGDGVVLRWQPREGKEPVAF